MGYSGRLDCLSDAAWGAPHADIRLQRGSFMGSRGRSIRLRIYFLVAIPLIALVGLLAYVADTSINNAISLDRAPNLVNATGIPAAKFGRYLEAERAAAVVYLFRPSAANLQAYRAAIAATEKAEPTFTAAMDSQATMRTESASGVKAIDGIVSDLSQLGVLRDAVTARALNPLDALAAYSQGPAAEEKLFLIQTESVIPTSQLSQAIGLVTVIQAREQLSQEDALLSGILARGRITADDRVAFGQMAATRQADAAYADYILSPADLASYNAALAGSGAMRQDLTGIEQAVAAGTPVDRLPVTPAQWQVITGTLLTDEFKGGEAVADDILVADHQLSHSAWTTVAVAGGLGLLGLLITIALGTLIGRGIIRGLRELESSALTLAEGQLPDVVGRLRRGDEVDVAAEAPPLRTGRRDEIGRVSQAFDLVRQTAIRSAVDEARLRRGLNDVFRSLARRSQSLLHRQLTLLDQMERRATDPSALDDLFRLDHLTTRMRRHAEGLVILSGGPSGRSWSSPVRMIDVMRGGIAEVEDYARVSVATRSQAALAGSAVADVIHLLAELIENATTLSPPYTSVRVGGDTVASGFAIEVEDRGLGMSPQRLAEVNERLASPPEFNPSDSEQLGLFVVAQLAKRHGIRVTLKASAYGGTTAVVLIPQHLVVTDEAYRAGLPGESRAGLPPGESRPGLPEAFRSELPEAFRSGRPEAFPPGLPGADDLPGVDFPGAGVSGDAAVIGMDPYAAPTTNGSPSATELAGRAGFGSDWGALDAAGASRLEPPMGYPPTGYQAGNVHDAPSGGPANGAEPANGVLPVNSAGTGADAQPAAAPGIAPFDVFMPLRRGQGGGEMPVPDDDWPGDEADHAPQPGSGAAQPGPGAPLAGSGAPLPGSGAPQPGSGTPQPGSGAPQPGPGAAPYPEQATPFPGWNPPPGPATPMTPVASPRAGMASGPPWELSRQTGPLPALPAEEGAQAQVPGPEGGDVNGLPRRVKQASLAPQLRDNPPQRRTSTFGALGAAPAEGPGGWPTAGPAGASSGEPTPAQIRQTMSALQRGWQEGRSASGAYGEQRPFGDGGPESDEPRKETDTDGV
jgi:signal transduction histidine kinase